MIKLIMQVLGVIAFINVMGVCCVFTSFMSGRFSDKVEIRIARVLHCSVFYLMVCICLAL